LSNQNGNEMLMKQILNAAKRFIDKEKTLIPDEAKMNSFLDAHNEIKNLCEENGYEFKLKAEPVELSPCDIILTLEMDYFGVSEMQMEDFKQTINGILDALKSFDISSADGCYIVNMTFEVYTVEMK